MQNLLKVLLLGTVLVSSDCLAAAAGWGSSAAAPYIEAKTEKLVEAATEAVHLDAVGEAAKKAAENSMSPVLDAVIDSSSVPPADVSVHIAPTPKVVDVTPFQRIAGDGNMIRIESPELAAPLSTDVSSMQLNGYTDFGAEVYTDLQGHNFLANGSEWTGSILPGSGVGGATKSGEALFNSLDSATQKVLSDQFSNANITAKDLTQEMVNAVKNGESLTSAAARAAAAATASADFSSWVAKRAGEIATEVADGWTGIFSNDISSVLGKSPLTSNYLTDQLANLGGKDLSTALSKMGTNMQSAAGELSKAIGENGGMFGTSTSFDSIKDLGPLGLQNALKDQLAKDITKKLTDEALSKYGKLSAEQTAEIQKQAEAEAAKKAAELLPIKVLTQNVVQYALVIWEALKGNEIDDATKEVSVKGAEPMQESQGSQGSGASTAPAASTAMSGTTIAGSANALIALLNMGKIDLSLLSTDIKKPEEGEAKGSVSATVGKSGAGVEATAQTATQAEEKELTTEEQQEIMHRRALLLGEWATAATQIGEGSNAISSAFYERSAAFSAAANAAQGSLGGITAITDTDRFVLFEITRGAALSAIQLGLQGAVNLNDVEEVADSEPTPENTPKAGVSVTVGKTQ